MRKAVKTEEHDRIVGRRHTTAQARGNAAESLAESFLAAKGCRTIARRFRCKAGELDLICLSGQTLLFVEVRMRSNPRFGSAAESITAEKRQRVIRAAQWWLAGPGRHHANRHCRFDVIAMDGLHPDQVQWLPGAFDIG